MHVVYETLRELGVNGKPVITVFNKQDRLEEPVHIKDLNADRTVEASARTGEGLEELKEVLSEILRADQIYVERLFPYDQAGRIQLIRKEGQLLKEEYKENGIEVKAYVPKELYTKVTGIE